MKQEVQLHRAKLLEEDIREKRSEAAEALLIEAEKEQSARVQIGQLEASMNDLKQKKIGNSQDSEREESIRANALDTLQKQLTSATNVYDRVSKPWRDAVRLDEEFRRQLADAEHFTQQISESCRDHLDIERTFGAFLKPSEWRIHKSFRG